MSEQTVLIAGHGQMGHAMETLLAGRTRLSVWRIAPDDLELPASVGRDAVAADFLLICTPTVAHAEILERLGPHLKHAAVLSIAKGLDDAGRCAADILQDYCGALPWGVLGGPMIANEIIAGKPAFAELGSYDKTLLRRLRGLYPEGGLSISGATNPHAVSWCGVLKNIYAPLVGISDELGWGDNARGHIVMTAVREMKAIVRILTSEDAQAYGDAGLADFVTTVTSASSHHYALGRRVARGDYGNLECEGIHSLQVLRAKGRIDPGTLALFGLATRLLDQRPGFPQALHDWLIAG